MKVKSIRVENYKGYANSGEIKLSESWNVVAGQNNSGKTAFIEAFRFNNNMPKPHRNSDIPRGYPVYSASKFIANLSIRRSWIKNCWLMTGNEFDLPFGSRAADGNFVHINPDDFWDGDDLNVVIDAQYGSASSKFPSHSLFESHSSDQFVRLSSSNRIPTIVSGPMNGTSDTLPILFAHNFSSMIYTFDAKRFAFGQCANQDSSVLSPDASNLPAVLIKLSSNPDLYEEFNANISTIFPQIKWISTTTKGQDFEIRVWPVDKLTRRDDLAVPLNESGTGVGQVLAILYVAMTSDPGVIAIDEPNSFLHPGAAKKLIQILKRYDKHQYIISTHSPEVMSAAQPAMLHLVRFDGKQSKIETFAENTIDTTRMMLEEIGASLSDVFSADQVIWVEGATERECFDLIVNERLAGPIIGLSFVALRNTSEFEGSEAEARSALEIYDALSKGGAILPVTTAFSFDRETKTERQIEDLKRRCGGRAKILPRRMTENYLLDPDGLADVLIALGETEIGSSAIAKKLSEFGPKHMPKGSTAAWNSPEGLALVDGANLLKDVFSEVTEARQEYRKVRDAVAILRALLARKAATLDELVEYVRGLVGGGA